MRSLSLCSGFACDVWLEHRLCHTVFCVCRRLLSWSLGRLWLGFFVCTYGISGSSSTQPGAHEVTEDPGTPRCPVPSFKSHGPSQPAFFPPPFIAFCVFSNLYAGVLVVPGGRNREKHPYSSSQKWKSQASILIKAFAASVEIIILFFSLTLLIR